jgi:hypothetical protein
MPPLTEGKHGEYVVKEIRLVGLNDLFEYGNVIFSLICTVQTLVKASLIVAMRFSHL